MRFARMLLVLAPAAMVLFGDAQIAQAQVRTVTVVFVNNSRNLRQLYVATPGRARVIGSFSQGGTLSVTILAGDRGTIPVSWRAGNLHGSFVITDDTGDYVTITLEDYRSFGP